jgi:hypothetical protein
VFRLPFQSQWIFLGLFPPSFSSLRARQEEDNAPARRDTITSSYEERCDALLQQESVIEERALAFGTSRKNGN